MMKCLFLGVMIVFWLYIPAVSAQISEGGLPPSFKYSERQMLRSAVNKIEVPVDFYIEDLREVDDWRAREGVPMPVAKLISVDYTIENSGSWTTLPGGEHVWRLHLKAVDAVAIMLYYKDFYIPEGGKLFIYSTDKSQLLGAYTNRTHPSGGLFATEFIGGDELILEYVESEISKEKPRIHIDEIGYGYNTSALETFCGLSLRAASGSCMVNINCEEGAGWQNEKKSVCYMVQKIGRWEYICTASLMNNTAEDFKPLILTARHCAYDANGLVASEDDMAQWVFSFHKEREDCNNGSLPVVAKTMVGCKMLVNTGMENGSDGMLLLLNQVVPEEYGVFYNGWDRRDTPATSGVCIHHPVGDYKKISTYGTPAVSTTFQSAEFSGTRYAHWNVTFQKTTNGYGVTEKGSSGSPLYNENKLVVGTLTGGSSSCSYSGGLNLYGKMSYHWDYYKADSMHMDIWLDPISSGVEVLTGRSHQVFKPAPVNLNVVNQGQRIFLTWEAPQSTEVPVCYNVYRNNQKVAEVVSLSHIDKEPVVGSLTYSVSAVYADDEESPFVSATISYVKFKAPSDLKAERADISRDVQLSWNPPVYEQTIYWGTLEPLYMVGISSDNSPFYYGQKWSSKEISPLHQKTIKAVRFIPIEKNRYEIYISQGNCVYRQPIESSSLSYSSMNTIMLDKAFVIDGSKSLIVSIYVSYAGSDYPAVCDNGPAVNEKGNICSFDGEYWGTLYDDEEPEEFDYNFVISVIVSSESGMVDDVCENDKNRLKRDIGKMSKTGIVKPLVAKIDTYDASTSSQSSMPALFPEITKYLIYRSGSVFKYIDPSGTGYMEKNAANSSYYEVSAFYGEVESDKSNRADIVTVDMENIDEAIDLYPTQFSGTVFLKGYDAVARVEVVSVSGKICLVVNRPDGMIDTSSLSPGLYFFRIYDRNHKMLKVVRAVKISG